jgi:N6-adenosine-specific RNA methylase IME4
MGTGDWLRGQTEHCGNPFSSHGRSTTVLAALRREHSRKPEEFYSLVEGTRPALAASLRCFAANSEVGSINLGTIFAKNSK